MSEKIICDKEDLTAIANALRASTGSIETYNVPKLSTAAVESIQDGVGAVGAVLYLKQALTEDQKEQARKNIEAANAINCEASGSHVSVPDAAAQSVVKLINHIEHVQSGSGDPSPNNVRPISEWDSVTTHWTGKNILPNGGAEKVSSFSLYDTDKAFEGAEGRTISVSFDLYSPDGSAVSIYAYQQSGLSISNGYDFMPGANMYVRYAFQTTIMRYGQTMNPGCIIFYSPSGAALKVKNVQVEFGGTATAYEPYQGQTLTADLPETVYGGMLDWNTGVLTSTHHKIIFDGVTIGAMVDATDPGVTSYAYLWKTSMSKALKYHTKAYANMLKGVATNTVISFGLPTELTGVTSADNPETVVAKYNAVLKQWYDAGTPLEIVYEIATPEEFQLTPQQLSTLKGTNNIWSNTGNISIAYVADTKIYIDNKFTELNNAILAMGANI